MKRGAPAAVVLVALAASAWAQGRPPLPFKDEKLGKWGFLDARGKPVLAPAYARVTRFQEGLAAVAGEPDRWEYIDPAGKTVIPGPFLEARPFAQERAAVRLDEGWGYIDPTGKLVIPARFHAAEDFREGRAVVRVKANGPAGAIDARGELVAPARFTFLGAYAGGLAPFSDGKKWGFVDRDGKPVIPAKFARADSFSEDLAFVVLKETKDRIDGAYIDRGGAVVIKGLTKNGGPFRGGLARVYDLGSGHWIDRTGKKAIESAGWIGDFSEGLAPVVEDGKVGYLDRTGKMVIAPQWASAGPFENGVAVVADLKDGNVVNHRYIDRTGKVIAKASETDPPPQ